MGILVLICLIVAAVFFGLATFGFPGIPPRVNLVAGGLFSAVLAVLVERLS
jgi:hypothetical protein